MTVTSARNGGAQRATRALRVRLAEAEATLDAIRSGQVDAIVVAGTRGHRTFTLDGAAHPYFVLLNAMGDGAALLDREGEILFGNGGLKRIARGVRRDVRGSPFVHLIVATQRPHFEKFLKAGARRKLTREFLLVGDNGRPTPVAIGLSPLAIDQAAASRKRLVLMAIVTDLTVRKRAEATRSELLERVITAEDQERRRIARELHDETGQALTALLVGLRSLEDSRLPRPLRPLAMRLRRLAAQTVDEVGRIARGLHPAVLDDVGLATAVRRYVRDYASALGIAVTLSARHLDSPKLPPLVAATVYRILQEALTNVARHARARHVWVALQRDAAYLELRVQDDGTGFDTGAPGTSRLGLHGMRERAALLGGTVQIEGRRGGGTTVRARIPAPRPSRVGARSRARLRAVRERSP